MAEQGTTSTALRESITAGLRQAVKRRFGAAADIDAVEFT